MDKKSLLNKPDTADASSGAIASGADIDVRFAVGEDGTISHASEGFCRLAGIKETEIRGCPLSDIISLGEEETSVLSFSEAGSKSETHSFVLKNSDEICDFYLEWLVVDGKKTLLGVCEDIPGGILHEKQDLNLKTGGKNKKASEKDLLQARDLKIFEENFASDIKIITDADGIIIGKGANAGEIGATSGRNILDIFDEEQWPVLLGHIRDLSLNFSDRGRKPIVFEAEIESEEGARLFGWQLIGNGERLYWIGRDQTEALGYKSQAEKFKTRLSQAESIGRMGHWRWEVGQDDIEWSDELYNIFGVEPAFQPSLQSINEMVLRRDIPRANQILQRAIIEAKDYETDFRIRRPDGSVRHIRCEGRCMLDADGGVKALFGVMQDMTERALYEQELKTEKDRAERAYAAKSQFLANMSHELRTPLNAIIGFSEMIQQQLLGPIGQKKYLEYVAAIRESGGHLLDLISDILSISKIEAGKYDLSLDDVNLYKTFRMALQLVEARAHEKNIIINVMDFPDEDIRIIADRRALLQITLNILSNAIKFTEEGGNIDFACLEREDYVVLKITDTGIGIPANKLASITNPFEQVAPSYTRDHEGSGLGLAITKELVEMHGGNLHIESRVGQGTTVSVRLPYRAVVSETAA